jgi:hypothetical protein
VTDAQLYLSIGIPTSAVLIGMLVNAIQYHSINARFNNLEASMNARFDSLESRFNSLDVKLDTLIGKVVNLHNA